MRIKNAPFGHQRRLAVDEKRHVHWRVPARSIPLTNLLSPASAMNLHPSLVSTLLQSKTLPLDRAVTEGVAGLGSAILPSTAVRTSDTAPS